MFASATQKLKEMANPLFLQGFFLPNMRNREMVPGNLDGHGEMAASGKGLYAELANSKKDIVAAQRLRYRVFTEEFGAKINNRKRVDKDRFDKFCRHVLVRDRVTGEVVGYTRLLGDEMLSKTKGFYSQTEFDMQSIHGLPGRVLEVGRTCIHKDYRNGGTIAVLWSKVTEILLSEGYDYLVGCASVGLDDGGANAAMVMDQVRERYLTAQDRRVRPYKPFKFRNDVEHRKAMMPALLKAYLRMGAKACGEPYLDDEFNVVDVFILLDIRDLPQRYTRHFFRQVQAA